MMRRTGVSVRVSSLARIQGLSENVRVPKPRGRRGFAQVTSARGDVMRCLLGLLLSLALSGIMRADEGAKSNNLTPQEIAEGWILLFDGKTTFGWTSPNDSKWTIIDGMLAPQKGKPGFLVTTTCFEQYEMKLQYNMRVEIGVGPQSPRPCILFGCFSDGD